eukprot:COSAG01_NODE_35553_length_530_cov_1.011601_1_plen_65_part_01
MTQLRHTIGSRLRVQSTAQHAVLRVRVEIMGPGKHETVGKSQSVPIMIDPSHDLRPHPWPWRFHR